MKSGKIRRNLLVPDKNCKFQRFRANAHSCPSQPSCTCSSFPFISIHNYFNYCASLPDNEQGGRHDIPELSFHVDLEPMSIVRTGRYDLVGHNSLICIRRRTLFGQEQRPQTTAVDHALAWSWPFPARHGLNAANNAPPVCVQCIVCNCSCPPK